MSLAVHIKRNLNEKYKNDKYLVPCENKTRELRKKYLKISENKPLVGISWYGLLRYGQVSKRPREEFDPTSVKDDTKKCICSSHVDFVRA